MRRCELQTLEGVVAFRELETFRFRLILLTQKDRMMISKKFCRT